MAIEPAASGLISRGRLAGHWVRPAFLNRRGAANFGCSRLFSRRDGRPTTTQWESFVCNACLGPHPQNQL